jgi:hypothetical protein
MLMYLAAAQASSATFNLTWEDVGVLLSIIVVAGGILLWIANALFQFGVTSQRLKVVEDTIRDDVKPGLQKISDKLLDIALAVNGNSVTESHSPRMLNAFGNKILDSSGIKKITDDRLTAIIEKVKAAKPENSYQAEAQILKVVGEIRDEPEMKNILEQGAFEAETNVGTVLYVGGIYIRDRVLKEIGMRPEDIDLHIPKQ